MPIFYYSYFISYINVYLFTYNFSKHINFLFFSAVQAPYHGKYG